MTTLAKLLATLAMLCGLVAGYFMWSSYEQSIGESRATARYNAAIDQQKARAGQLLQVETDRANAVTARLIELKTEREKQDVENQSTIDRLAVRLRAAAGPAARLRDPNASAAGCGVGGGGATGADPARAGGGPVDDASDPGLLSKQLTEFLLAQAADADQVNLAYISCRADSLSLREVLK